MSRRTLIPSTSLDEDIRALMADIDASLIDFERRLQAEQASQRPPAADETPLPAPQPATPQPAIPAPKSADEEPRTESSAIGGLLAELELAAKEKLGTGKGDNAAQNREVHDALNRVFRFLDVFCRHTNVLQPSISRNYRLDTRSAYTGLQWREAWVKSRRRSLSEKSLLDCISFRVRLAAPAPVTVSVGWDKMEAFRKDMHLLDLQVAVGTDPDGRAEGDEFVIELAPSFPVQITFAANYDNNRIDILCRNLEGFGIAAFTCDSRDVTDELLDGLGRFLLARGNTLPAALRRVNSRAEL